MIRPSGGHDHSLKRFLSGVFGLAARGEAAPEAVSSLTNKAGGIAAAFRLGPQPREVAGRSGAA